MKTDPKADPPYKGMTCFITEKEPWAEKNEGDFAGLEIPPKIKKMGYKGVESTELVYNGYRCSEDRILGGPRTGIGEGFRQMMDALEVGRVNVAARGVGIAQRALELALRYSQERKTFGKPIAQHQAIQFKLADMATKVEAARLVTRKAARMKDAGERSDLEAGMAKLLASETGKEGVEEAFRIHGGYGYSKEYEIERLYRDAPLLLIGEGTSEIQRMVIGKKLRTIAGSPYSVPVDATAAGGGMADVPIELDVTDQRASTRPQSDRVGPGPPDVLVNNAGWAAKRIGAADSTSRRGAAPRDQPLGAWRCSAGGAAAAARSDDAAIVNVSSGAGQLDDMQGGYPAYRISKSGLNALTRILAAEERRVRSTRSAPAGSAPTWAAAARPARWRRAPTRRLACTDPRGPQRRLLQRPQADPLVALPKHFFFPVFWFGVFLFFPPRTTDQDGDRALPGRRCPRSPSSSSSSGSSCGGGDVQMFRSSFPARDLEGVGRRRQGHRLYAALDFNELVQDGSPGHRRGLRVGPDQGQRRPRHPEAGSPR